MFEQFSKPLKMNEIQIYLLDVACLISMQNVAARKLEKWYPLSLDQKRIFG
jgi:hypothetical protein